MGNSHFQVQRKKNKCASESGPHATAIPRHVSVHPQGDFAKCSLMWAKREKWIHVVLEVWIVISGTHKQNWVLAWLAKQKRQNGKEKNDLMLRRGEIRQMLMLLAYENKPLMWFIQQLVLINHFDWTSIPRVLVQKVDEGLGLIYTTGPTMWRSVVWFSVFAPVSDRQLQSKVHHVESKQKQNKGRSLQQMLSPATTAASLLQEV